MGFRTHESVHLPTPRIESRRLLLLSSLSSFSTNRNKTKTGSTGAKSADATSLRVAPPSKSNPTQNKVRSERAVFRVLVYQEIPGFVLASPSPNSPTPQLQSHTLPSFAKSPSASASVPLVLCPLPLPLPLPNLPLCFFLFVYFFSTLDFSHLLLSSNLISLPPSIGKSPRCVSCCYLLAHNRTMGRGRGKGKKSIITSLEDSTIGEEEKISSQKQNGSAEQAQTDEIKEEELGRVEAIDEQAKTDPGKVIENPNPAETGKKRKRNSSMKEKMGLVNDASCKGTQTSIVQVKSNGFRHHGSRRKSKPRRAAEAVVECR
ncbi:hypothetical protein SDJN02_02635, partial [Cucurbita argyrosperma subsp. argyrosperma]